MHTETQFRPGAVCLAAAACLFALQAVALGQDGGSSGAPAADVRQPDGLQEGPVDAFTLRDLDGRPRDAGEWSGQELLVVAFLGCECPIARGVVRRLNELKEQFERQSVGFIAINSNQQDSLEDLRRFARETDLKLPLFKDPGNRVADQFGALRTPEVFVLDRRRVIRYAGRVDDQFSVGRQRPAATTHELRDAIVSLLAGEPVAISRTDAPGCIIGRVLGAASAEPASVTWCGQISRIVFRHCASCHRAGEIAPFELLEYGEAAGWAGMIREVVNERRMPPWHASPEHGRFRNDASLTPEEIDLVNRWVDEGAPEGDRSLLPPRPRFAEGWQIGEPDVVIAMSETPFQVPATGTVDYQYFQVETGFTEDRWVCAAECRPGKRSVIHHIIVGIAGEGDFRDGRHDRLQSDWIAAAAPGSPPLILPDGYAKRIPAGARLVFQMHYTPNGTPAGDISSIGLRFVDPESVTHRVLTVKAHNERFRIPPRAASHAVRAETRFDRSGQLLSLFPHMHLRGKAFRYTAILPDGREEILLDVPRYDFNWQNAYELAEIRDFPAGTGIRCDALFDNSADNLANPDPDHEVRWGDQTWEEMMIGYMNVAVPVRR